jgi:hypothetical protein
MMGFPPREVDLMSLWQFQACRAGWLAAQGVKMCEPARVGDHDEAAALLDRALAAGRV